jgi:hypothetical protein
MQGSEFDDAEFFRELGKSGARALLIGRRALIALGAPLMTVDYDLWLHIDDIEKLNASFEPLEHFADRSPQKARETGRYVLENGERIDVMVARAATAPDGVVLSFVDAWERKQELSLFGSCVYAPCIDDLIVTKRWGSRPKDMVDIQWLTELGTKR